MVKRYFFKECTLKMLLDVFQEDIVPTFSQRVLENYIERDIVFVESFNLKGQGMGLLVHSNEIDLFVDKDTGCRDIRITSSSALMPVFSNKSKLKVVYKRCVYEGDEVTFELEEFEKPMQVFALSISTSNEEVLAKIEELEKRGLKSTTKTNWEYFRRKIAIAGGPSSGKSTVAREMVNTLGIIFKANVELVSEYARTYIARNGVPKWYLQPLILWGQEYREQDAKHADTFVTDSPKFLPYFYTKRNLDKALDNESTYVLSKLYNTSLHALREYTDIILLKPRPVVPDGIRVQTTSDASELYDDIRSFLDSHKVNYIGVVGENEIEAIVDEVFTINKSLEVLAPH